ncbi:MAG: hypothetical protein R3D05_18195 [Dongiaceae bacterium]
MLERFVERSVAWAIAHAKLVIAVCFACTAAAVLYSAHSLKMDTDTAHMISDDLPWKQEMAKINVAFPQNVGLLVVMIDGQTPDAARAPPAAPHNRQDDEASGLELACPRARHRRRGPFHDRYGMMLLDTKDLDEIARSVIRAQPFIASLAADPSLRGLFDVLSLAMEGVARKATDFASLERPLTAISTAISGALTGNETPMSWRNLMIDKPVDKRELRKLILAQPKRDFQALQPGAKASAAIREMARDLQLTPDRGVTVRLTGAVPLTDEEFGTVAEGMSWALFVSIVWF